ncbi:TPA: hypothetical protein MI822_11650 [Klebsiella pneumoniae]|nr:hypothetical protein AM364_08710 [Klebsiella pneumoniae]HBY8017945.1 hypothetical protein [Klebsiella pneumoniae]
MMSLWDALRMNMMISYQELVRTFLSLVKEIVGIAIDHDLSLSDVIEIKRRMLIRRSTSAAKSKYTIDLWKWLTLEALEASIVFMNNGKDIFGSISIFEMSSATYE